MSVFIVLEHNVSRSPPYQSSKVYAAWIQYVLISKCTNVHDMLMFYKIMPDFFLVAAALSTRPVLRRMKAKA